MSKIFLVALTLVVLACGSDSGDRDEYFNSTEEIDPNSETPPRQSFVVRTNYQTGQAEYALANFDGKTHPQALANMAEGIKEWRPIKGSQVISSQKGYPSQGKRQIYFVADPQSFSQNQNAYPQVPTQYVGYDFGPSGTRAGNYPSQLPSGPGYGGGNYPTQLPSGPGYGGGNYPSQLPSGPGYGGGYPSQPIYNPPGPAGGPGYGGGGYYPYCNTMNYANCYGYLPATYMNTWMYWTPTYYYPTQNCSYAFYSYGW